MGLEIRRLDSQVGSLQAEEDKFNALAKKQGKNADSLVRLVKENKETIDGLKVRISLTIPTLLTLEQTGSRQSRFDADHFERSD